MLPAALLSALSLLAIPAFAATADVSANEAPPLEMLPRWAVPQSYELALQGDPAAAGYQGVVTIAVDLKKASDHLWLHGKDLRVTRVTLSDAHGHAYAGRYREAVPQAGIARVDFGEVVEPQRVRLTIAFSAAKQRDSAGLLMPRRTIWSARSLPPLTGAGTSSTRSRVSWTRMAFRWWRHGWTASTPTDPFSI